MIKLPTFSTHLSTGRGNDHLHVAMQIHIFDIAWRGTAEHGLVSSVACAKVSLVAFCLPMQRVVLFH